MPKYRICYTQRALAYAYVEADSVEEAVEKGLKQLPEEDRPFRGDRITLIDGWETHSVDDWVTTTA